MLKFKEGMEPSKSEVLAEYSRAVSELRAEGLHRGLSTDAVERLVTTSLEAVAPPPPPRQGRLRRALRALLWLLKVLLAMCVLYAVVACHSPTQKTLSRHIQPFIYPFMRGLRKLTLPILRAYPDLTEWHEEPCLVRNPFYGLRGPDCWPCDGVRSVLVLATSPSNFAEDYYHSGLPFIIQGGGGTVGWTELQQLHVENAELLQRSAPRLLAEGLFTSSLALSELLALPERNVSELHPHAHLVWKVTRSDSARVLRQVFAKPQFVPAHTEVAIQRFLYIDSPLAPKYLLPMTDYANVWVAQGSGSRLVLLTPSPQCNKRCHPVSVLLQKGDILFYNWQFWRPRSLPVQGASTLSVTYVGSFY